MTAGRLLRPCRLFARRSDARGSTIIEFALLAPAFIALLLAALQTALVMFTQQGIQTAAEFGARRLAVGAAQKAGESADTFKASLCPQLPDYVKCANLLVDVRSASTLAALDLSMPPTDDNGDGTYTGPHGYAPGGPDAYVLIRLLYVTATTPGPLGFNLGNLGRGNRLVTGTLVVKTEPYNP